MDETQDNSSSTSSLTPAQQYGNIVRWGISTANSAASGRLKVAASNKIWRDRTGMDARRRAILKRAVTKKI